MCAVIGTSTLMIINSNVAFLFGVFWCAFVFVFVFMFGFGVMIWRVFTVLAVV